MNILYGVQATGNGHISRSREVVKALRGRGHQVRVLLSGRAPEDLWELDDFAPYDLRPGLSFVTRNGQVDYLATVRRLRLLRLRRDVREYEAGRYDLVITDYEPVTARIARLRRLPCVGLGHQYAFWHDRVPRANGNLLARWVFRRFTPVDFPLGLHWHHFGAPLLPPIVPLPPDPLPAPVPGKVLVYLVFETLPEVLAALRQVPEAEFFVYAAVPAATDEGNLHLRPFSRAGFLADLYTCAGVLANAGFELSSEALRAGRKLLVKPLAGQMEQESNALALARLNAAAVLDRLAPELIRAWLALPDPEPAHYPDVPELIAEWLGRGHLDQVAELSGQAWAATRQPAHFRLG